MSATWRPQPQTVVIILLLFSYTSIGALDSLNLFNGLFRRRTGYNFTSRAQIKSNSWTESDFVASTQYEDDRAHIASDTLRLIEMKSRLEQQISACPGLEQSWISEVENRVAFIGDRFNGFDDYQSGKYSLSGESYWAASLDYTLKLLGFSVDHHESLDSLNTSSYYRIIFDGYPEKHLTSLSGEVLCRSRCLHFWGGDGIRDFSEEFKIDHRLILTPYMDNPRYLGNPIPYFPHSLVTFRNAPVATRERKCFVLGKTCDYFGKSNVGINVLEIIRTMQEIGFDVHTTPDCGQDTTYHGMLSPFEFSKLLRSMAFVVQTGHPLNSPTPFEALANGATFITGGLHPVLEGIGPPYVYRYTDIDSLKHAAEQAMVFRFSSFVPFSHRLESMIGTVCSNLLLNDAPCACEATKLANQTCSGNMYPMMHL